MDVFVTLTVFSDVVQRFYRLNNPPQPSESLEASQVSYCVSVNNIIIITIIIIINYYYYYKLYWNSQKAFQTNNYSQGKTINSIICKLFKN